MQQEARNAKSSSARCLARIAKGNLLPIRVNQGEIYRAGRFITGARFVRETGRIPRIL